MVRPAHLSHLARRFFGSLRPGGPPQADETWVASLLEGPELDLWRRMSGADRRHAVGVAREVASRGLAAREVLAAALLHDVGKVEARLGTLGRALVTALALVAGRDRVSGWSPAGRAGRYLRHGEIGAGLVARAGGHPLAVAWAREHHLDPSSWTVPPAAGAALKAADDD